MENIFSAEGLNEIHLWEKAVVHLLNLDGWDLKHTGGLRATAPKVRP